MLIRVLKKMLNIQHINHAHRVPVVVLQKVQNQLNVATVLEKGKLELIKDFLRFNKHARSVVGMVKLLENRVIPVVVTVKFKPMKM